MQILFVCWVTLSMAFLDVSWCPLCFCMLLVAEVSPVKCLSRDVSHFTMLASALRHGADAPFTFGFCFLYQCSQKSRPFLLKSFLCPLRGAKRVVSMLQRNHHLLLLLVAERLLRRLKYGSPPKYLVTSSTGFLPFLLLQFLLQTPHHHQIIFSSSSSSSFSFSLLPQWNPTAKSAISPRLRSWQRCNTGQYKTGRQKQTTKALRWSSHWKTTLVCLQVVVKDKFPRSDAVRCPFFFGCQISGRPSTGDVIATAFPRFVITFMTVTSCATKKLSDQSDVTCDPQVGAGVIQKSLRSRLYASCRCCCGFGRRSEEGPGCNCKCCYCCYCFARGCKKSCHKGRLH